MGERWQLEYQFMDEGVSRQAFLDFFGGISHYGIEVGRLVESNTWQAVEFPNGLGAIQYDTQCDTWYYPGQRLTPDGTIEFGDRKYIGEGLQDYSEHGTPKIYEAAEVVAAKSVNLAEAFVEKLITYIRHGYQVDVQNLNYWIRNGDKLCFTGSGLTIGRAYPDSGPVFYSQYGVPYCVHDVEGNIYQLQDWLTLEPEDLREKGCELSNSCLDLCKSLLAINASRILDDGYGHTDLHLSMSNSNLNIFYETTSGTQLRYKWEPEKSWAVEISIPKFRAYQGRSHYSWCCEVHNKYREYSVAKHRETSLELS